METTHAARPVARISLGPETNWPTSRALELLGDMGECNIKATMITPSMVITACGDSHQLETALVVLDLMERTYQLTPGVCSFSAAISACEKGGQWKKALGLLESVEAR